jgi:upstream activation factor subunit UAF30
MADASPVKGKRPPGAAFMKPVKPDEKLAAVIGTDPVPRTEVTRKVWDYVRKNNLQDPENKTFIRADPLLKEVFGGKDRVSMFEMTRLVFEHVS